MLKRVIAFFSTLLLCAGLAWVGGYNFDHRGELVALGAFWALLFACFAASYPGFGEKA